MQKIANFDISKIFVVFAVILVLHWLFFARHRFKTFPRLYNYFILYIILHTIIVYTVFVPEELGFGYLGEVPARAKGFVVQTESSLIQILRMFIFMFLAYAAASYIKTKKRLHVVSLAYGLGLFLSSMLGSYYHLNRAGTISQFAGGFLNPNFYGVTAMTAVWLSLYVAVVCKKNLWIRILAIILFGISVYEVLRSVSRASILALCVGLVVMLLFIRGLKRKIQFIILVAVIGLPLLFGISNEVTQDVYGRFSINFLRDSSGSSRLDIWSEYLSACSKYVLTGIGIRRSKVAIEDFTKFETPRATHSTYLETLVEFGIVGFVLFISALWQFWRKLTSLHVNSKEYGDAVFLGFFVSWCVAFLFHAQFGTRSLWLSLAIIAAYISLRTKEAALTKKAAPAVQIETEE